MTTKAFCLRNFILLPILLLLVTGYNTNVLSAAPSADSKGNGNLIWAKCAQGVFGLGITTLSDNSTVVTGDFNGTATFGPGEANETVLTSAGNNDIFIARYNPDGTLLWAKRAGGTDYDVGRGITSLSDNSTVVTGNFCGTATFGEGEINEITLTSLGLNDIFIARYNPNGTLSWAKRMGGLNNDIGCGITTLSDNSTIVTGNFSDKATFGPDESNQIVLASAGSIDVFIARYNPDGSLAWVKRAGGKTGEEGFGITTLSDNSTVVTGTFYGSATFGPGEINQTVLSSATLLFQSLLHPYEEWGDISIARYNPDGTLLWAKRAGGKGSDEGNAVTTLSDNSTVVAGSFIRSATFGQGEPNQTVLTSAGGADIFIARYNPDGSLAWVKRAGGSDSDNYSDIGWGITTLSDNSTIVDGHLMRPATFGKGEPNQTVLQSSGGGFIARYNPDGSLAWAKSAGKNCRGITTLSDNSTVVIGNFSGSSTFGKGETNEIVLTSVRLDGMSIARFAP